MSINVNKKNIYMILPNSGYETSEKVGNFMEKDFTLFVRAKINKKKLSLNEDLFLVSRNGKHSGVSVRLNEFGEIYLNCCYWFVDIKTGQEKYLNSNFSIPDGYDNIFNDYTINCDDKNKKIKYYFNDIKIAEIDYNGYIKEDYTNSFLWVGCGNMITEDEYSGIGDFDIKLVIGVDVCLTVKEIEKIISDDNFNIDKDFNLPVLNDNVSHFKNYKIFSDFDYYNNYKIWNMVNNGVFFQKYIKDNIFF